MLHSTSLASCAAGPGDTPFLSCGSRNTNAAATRDSTAKIASGVWGQLACRPCTAANDDRRPPIREKLLLRPKPKFLTVVGYLWHDNMKGITRVGVPLEHEGVVCVHTCVCLLVVEGCRGQPQTCSGSDHKRSGAA